MRSNRIRVSSRHANASRVTTTVAPARRCRLAWLLAQRVAQAVRRDRDRPVALGAADRVESLDAIALELIMLLAQAIERSLGLASLGLGLDDLELMQPLLDV